MAAAATISLALTFVIAGHPARAAPEAGAADGRPAGAGTYTLVTGERVAVTTPPGGTPSVTVVSGTGAMEVLASGGHLYVLPHAAAGYIGRPLSLDLFDVSALPRDGSGNLPPLTVEYAPGSDRRLPPGMSASAQGQVTVEDPAAFGKALGAQWSADKRGGGSELFAGIERISLAGAKPPEPPSGELFTLTVKGFDRRGHRVSGDMGVVMNTGDSGAYIGRQSFFRGEFAVSVPAGRYSISSFISTLHPGNTVDFTLAAAPEVAVTRDTTVILDARRGERVSASAPRPTTPVHAELIYQRDPAAGLSFAASFTTFDATPLYATPTSPVETGELHFYPFFRLAGTGDDLRDYLYDLAFAYPGAIPPDPTRTVTQDELATVDTRYHSAVPGRAELEVRLGFAPWQALAVGAAGTLVAPTERTEYVMARPDLRWLQVVGTDLASGAGVAQSHLLSYRPGERTRAEWLAQPMAPGIQQQPEVGQACPACRAGDILNLMVMPYVDNGGHFMLAEPGTGERLTLYQDGVPVGSARSGFASFPMSPDLQTYRLVYEVGRDAPWWPTSTAVRTEWTFASQRRTPDRLPPGWTCDSKSKAAPGDGEGCSFEPLLFTHYSTSAGPDDVVAADGPATVDVSVGHQRGGSGAAVTGFSAQVSYDDGTSWRDVPASAHGDGVFRLAYRQPPLDETTGFASLRIRASDAAGSAIEQTVIRAYPLAVTSPARLPTTPDQGVQPACAADVAAPYVRCLAEVNTAAGVSLGGPVGLAPADIQSAYGLPPGAGEGRTVAVVAAYDNPNAESDLAVYREQWGLPPCTTANGCFRKVNQRGEATGLPAPDPGWGLEISLDLDAVSAVCPSCRILLVEADSASLADLIPAVLTAQRLGADAISNSYGTIGEFSGEQYLERFYRSVRVPFVVASGDYGYGNGRPLIGGVSYPSASQFAVAVGGTTLTRSDSERGWSETAWGGATSGCSAYIRKPGWQKDDLCGMRTVADVAAVADPATGLAVYDTFGFGGWLQVGGTSLAAPLVAGGYAMGGDGTTPGYASGLYREPGHFYDITQGANGDNCAGSYLCTAVPGYDGPTGLGTPSGIGAF